MAERNNLVHRGTVGGDADPATIEKVYVGVPDALRLQALGLAVTVESRQIHDKDDPIVETILATAADFESYLNDGWKGDKA